MKPTSQSKPHLIIMSGAPGSGKSYFAENFAKSFNSPIIRIEKIIEEFFDSYSDKKTVLTKSNEICHDFLTEILKTKQTVIYDPIFNNKLENEIITNIAKKFGYKILYILVQTDTETAKKRLSKQTLLNKVINNNLINKLEINLNPLTQQNRAVVVISGKHTYASQLKKVLNYLAKS